jgi:hypothetical protein
LNAAARLGEDLFGGHSGQTSRRVPMPARMVMTAPPWIHSARSISAFSSATAVLRSVLVAAMSAWVAAIAVFKSARRSLISYFVAAFEANHRTRRRLGLIVGDAGLSERVIYLGDDCGHG